MNETTLDQVVRSAAQLVAPMFREHGWTWWPGGVPDVTEIEATLRQLHQFASSGAPSETGRLLARHDHVTGATDFYLHIGWTDDPPPTGPET